jgi:hypothetical protein
MPEEHNADAAVHRDTVVIGCMNSNNTHLSN